MKEFKLTKKQKRQVKEHTKRFERTFRYLLERTLDQPFDTIDFSQIDYDEELGALRYNNVLLFVAMGDHWYDADGNQLI